MAPADRPGTGRTLRVELEDPLSVPWWARVLYTLTSQYGRSPMRFVARADDGRILYRGATFAGPALGRTAPQEAWTPGLEASLAELRAEIVRDGWAESSRGRRPWDLTYRRSGSAEG
ncbi:hypothetical protein J2W20_002149 [Sinomonas atrocyanea]|uniref:hypothetical protein n=1 Tax=Sinomonas atrocyanea TaxID=37927 RepID=UPI00278860E2|nr:hypothetical protein [Sinomonas atrocyanea]MDQ0260245.1 hypothetical protein [Sinomonas atrocyanea]